LQAVQTPIAETIIINSQETIPTSITTEVAKTGGFEDALIDIFQTQSEKPAATRNPNTTLPNNTDANNDNPIRFKDISFLLPPDMLEIDEGFYYSADLPLLLNILTYDSKNFSAITVLEEWIDLISIQTNIEESKFIFHGTNLEGGEAAIYVLLGTGKSEGKVEWQGVLVSLDHNDLIYLLAWDAMGAESINRLPEDFHALMKTLVLK
jgi:hypothetical protein